MCQQGQIFYARKKCTFTQNTERLKSQLTNNTSFSLQNVETAISSGQLTFGPFCTSSTFVRNDIFWKTTTLRRIYLQVGQKRKLQPVAIVSFFMYTNSASTCGHMFCEGAQRSLSPTSIYPISQNIKKATTDDKKMGQVQQSVTGSCVEVRSDERATRRVSTAVD
jgi:hypothetical protein